VPVANGLPSAISSKRRCERVTWTSSSGVGAMLLATPTTSLLSLNRMTTLGLTGSGVMN